MVVYRNTGGRSGVVAYEIGDESIKVRFSDGSLYLYKFQSAGSYNIERMKDLAIKGSGLNSFINSVVRYKYASRLRWRNSWTSCHMGQKRDLQRQVGTRITLCP